MNRYLIPIQQASQAKTVQRIPIEDNPLGIYRLDNGNHDVVVEDGRQTIELGIQDAGVSRKQNGIPPVELIPTSHGLDVKNKTSTNPISIQTNSGKKQLGQGESIEITDDCVVELGIGVQIRAAVRGDTESHIEKSGHVHDQQSKKQSGPEIDAYVGKVGELIRTRTENESVVECRTQIQTLHDTIIEFPVDDQAYSDIESKIEHILERLEAKVKNPRLSEDNLSDDLQGEIISITDRVEELYARN